ncbi:MAG TPA: cytochrome P450 [Solirubrobacteraceae bacterium]|nr:cytochrome P450 [Solirubrobacteraceae bacterium]
MTTSAPEVPYFDLSDPAFSVRSPQLRAAQERSWYARTNYGLAVLRYDEVGRLLRDRRLRQGSRNWPALNGVGGPWAQWWCKAVLNLEGADHKRLRRLLTPAFSPGLITSLVPRFQALGTELIDAFVDDGRCEFVSQFAEPYATRVIAIMLGLPESEWRRIADWAGALGLALGVELRQRLPEIEAALEGLYGYADEVIADRRRAPRDDFMTRLVHAHSDEDRLTEDELRVQVVLLIFGGVDTTRSQLGLAMQTFMEHPSQWELLAERPELGAAAVEEVMRVTPTVTWVTREALEDFSFEGVEIRAGTVLHLLSAVAGTDPRVFDPPPFDITVDRARHFGFGGGVHHCIGHFVARNDMSEALPLLARRLARPRVDGEVSSLPPSGNTGPLRLPIAFDARGA